MSTPQISKENRLAPHEEWWRDHFDWLKSKGYELRPRYRPEWTPAWEKTGESRLSYEDHVRCTYLNIMDGKRLSDGKAVFFKRIAADDRERQIIEFLSNKERLKDPRNHCVPLLETIIDDCLDGQCIIVMPLMKTLLAPKFVSVDEALEFVRQVLEGVVYLHSVHVAHRDLGKGNILLDAPEMFPNGFHPMLQGMLADFSGAIRPRRRRSIEGLRYVFIDFGISMRFESESKRTKVLGFLCQDKTVPELGRIDPYDPFKVDIYTVGNVFKRMFISEYSNMAFLSPLVDAMTQEDPEKRPDASAALMQFGCIVKTLSYMEGRWRLRPLKSGVRTTLSLGFASFADEGLHASKKLLKAWSRKGDK